MPLQRTLVELPVQTGLQQKTDPRLIDNGAQTTLTNLVQDKIGALQKRPGINDLGSLSSSQWGNTLAQASYSDARLLPSAPGGLAQISGGRMWSRGTTTATAYDLDSVTNVLVDEFGIQVAENSLTTFDLCTNGATILVVWTTLNSAGTTTAWYALYDAVTYDVIRTAQQIGLVGSPGSAQCIKCCSISATNAIVLAQETNTLYAYSFSWSTLALGNASSIQTVFGTANIATTGTGGLTFYGNFDISAVQGTANAIIAYGALNASNNPLVVTATITAALAAVAHTSTQVSALTTTRVHGVAVIGSSTNNIAWVSYALNTPSTNTVRAYGLPIALTSVTIADTALWTETVAGAVPETLTLIADPTTAAWARIIVAGSRVSLNAITTWVTFNSSAAVSSVIGARQGLIPASKLFTVGNLVLGLLYYTAGNPSFNGISVLPSYYVAELQISGGQVAGGQNFDMRYMATVGPRIANAGLYTSATITISSSPPITALQVLTMGSTIRNANTQSGLDIFNVYYSNALYQPAVLGDSTYITGGAPCSFDGQRVINHNFPYQPPSVTPSLASTLGGGLGSYTYTYAAVYEWHTKTGERKQSQPTLAPYTSTASSGIASIVVPCCNLSLEQDWEASYSPPIGIAIYRDTAAAPGTLVRLFADVPGSNFNVFNSTITYTDNNADSAVQSNEQLYTLGNVLGAQCPPSLKCLIAHNGRLAGIGGDGLVWLTTKWDEGTTQPYFNDALTLAVGDFGRPTVIVSMDGNLIIFKRDAVYVVQGDGPQNDGTGNTWSQAQRLTVDCGCSGDWRGALVFPGGVTFQNGSKLFVLTRGFESQYFSGPVEDQLAANPVIVGSAVYSTRTELRFVCKPSETATTGVVLNFNYVTQTWSVFQYYDTDKAVTGADIDSCIALNGSWYHATFTGRLYQEDTSGQFYDVASQWITGTRETAWLKTQGVQGFGRVWNALVLETDYSPHDLFISAAYNYGSLYVDTASFTASMIGSFTTNQPQMQLHLTRQKAESLRLKIYDGPPNGSVSSLATGQGANIIGVTVEAGIKKGRFRLPEGQAQ